VLRTEPAPPLAEERTGPRHFKESRLLWWPLAVVVIGYVALASVVAWRTPAWENNDESDHIRYVEHVVATGLPPAISLQNGIESHQAPLYYYLAAGWQDLLGIPSFTPNAQPATDSPTWRGVQLDYLSHAYTPAQHRQAVWVHELRLLSIIFGIVTITAAYATGWLLLRRTLPAAALATTVALWPKFLVVTTAVTNSSLAYALCAAGLPLLVLWWHRRRLVWAAGFGAVAGAAALTDITTLPLTGVSLLIVIGLSARRRDWISPAAALGSFLGIAGWWFGYNIERYGDPLRSRITTDYLKPYAGGALIRQPPHLSAQILSAYGRVLVHSFWWDGQWNQLHLPGNLDWGLTFIALFCIAATLAYRLTGWFLVTGYAAGSAIAWLLLVRATTQGEGRYLLIAIVAWAWLLISGITKAARGHPAAWWIWPAAFLGVDLWLVAALLIPYGQL
jgi:hypothetical protein